MADTNEYVALDSRVMDRCIQMKDKFISRYDDIVTSYDQTVGKLSENWKGEGADAFISDAKVVRTNIKGIADILSTMCSTLQEVRVIMEEVDKQIGEYNRNPDQE